MNAKHDEHGFVDTLLPWYLNGSLDEDETQRVVLHLATCTRCRGTLSFLESLDTDFAAMDVREHDQRLPDDLRRQLSQPRRWAWPAALAAGVVLAFVLGMSSSFIDKRMNEPAYRTATSSVTTMQGAVAIVDIRFAEDTSIADLGNVLQRFENVSLTRQQDDGWYRLEIPINATITQEMLLQELAATNGIEDIRPASLPTGKDTGAR